ncbi:MAG: Mur ligase family protein [Coraliomargarita sp.]
MKPAGQAGEALPRRVAVFGAGRSGRAAIRLCRHAGISGQLFDEDPQCADCRSGFGERELGDFDAFVFSPGFASGHRWRVLCHESGLPCFGETGFAASFWEGRLLGVTGTNGKSSVTSLLAESLRRSGAEAVAAGNIGMPLSDAWVEQSGGAAAWAVCEISSFQAELPEGLALDGLVWTNFAEDHLDRYGSMESYLRAKANLLDRLRPGAPSVLGPSVPLEPGSPLSDDTLPPVDLPEASPFSRGAQAENLRLVRKLWRALDLPEASLLAAASEYRQLPHRLQKVAERDGVAFWNDSKATNFHAALAAVRSMRDPVFWIGGGRVKGGDFAGFSDGLSGIIAGAYLYGEAGPALAGHLSGKLDRVSVFTRLEEAVEAAACDARAAAPAAVLLSPGFSSFDQFSGFEERGECFTSALLSL